LVFNARYFNFFYYISLIYPFFIFFLQLKKTRIFFNSTPIHLFFLSSLLSLLILINQHTNNNNTFGSNQQQHSKQHFRIQSTTTHKQPIFKSNQQQQHTNKPFSVLFIINFNTSTFKSKNSCIVHTQNMTQIRAQI